MWQRVLSPNLGEIDPEHEQELRLVAQARAGAAWALSALVARYQPPVVRYLVRLTGSPERGRALAEAVLVRMSRRVRGPHGGDHLRLWLLRACTESGLEALRHPERGDPRRLGAGQGPVALIAGRVNDTPMGKWMAGWGARRQKAPEARPPVPTQQFVWQAAADGPAASADEPEPVAPREALKYRMVRAVLAELPYGDAQCLSLHLVAGLNQTEVAQALGITPAVARRRIVQGLQLFGRRYEAALAGLGLSPDFASQPAASAPPAAFVPPPSAPPAYVPPRPAPLPQPAAPGMVSADASLQAPPRVPTGAPFSLMPTIPAAPAASASISPAARADGPETAEAADASERALTSAAIIAYLRAAAANPRPREPVPAAGESIEDPAGETIVDALPVASVIPAPALLASADVLATTEQPPSGQPDALAVDDEAPADEVPGIAASAVVEADAPGTIVRDGPTPAPADGALLGASLDVPEEAPAGVAVGDDGPASRGAALPMAAALASAIAGETSAAPPVAAISVADESSDAPSLEASAVENATATGDAPSVGAFGERPAADLDHLPSGGSNLVEEPPSAVADAVSNGPPELPIAVEQVPHAVAPDAAPAAPPTVHLPRDLAARPADVPARAPRIVPVLRPPDAPESATLVELEAPLLAVDGAPLAAPAPSAMLTNADTDAELDAAVAVDAADGEAEPVPAPVLAAEPSTPLDGAPVFAAEPAHADGDDADPISGDRIAADGAEDGTDSADEYLLVVEPETDAPAAPSDLDGAGVDLEADAAMDAAHRARHTRRVHVLSADGEAEDPTDTAIWPLP
jgi:DNA-directed RNA polymerase specialized sigma24 family protein